MARGHLKSDRIPFHNVKEPIPSSNNVRMDCVASFREYQKKKSCGYYDRYSSSNLKCDLCDKTAIFTFNSNSSCRKHRKAYSEGE
jgi:hypothetical protein